MGVEGLGVVLVKDILGERDGYEGELRGRGKWGAVMGSRGFTGSEQIL